MHYFLSSYSSYLIFFLFFLLLYTYKATKGTQVHEAPVTMVCYVHSPIILYRQAVSATQTYDTWVTKKPFNGALCF